MVTCPGSNLRCYVYYWDNTKWSDPITNVIKVRIDDEFMQPKFAEITIVDFDHALQNSPIFSPYQRIKIEDIESEKVLFFGRLEFFDIQNKDGGTYLILQCKDYLSELQQGPVEHDFSGALTLGELVQDVVDYHTYTEISYSGLTGGNFTISEHENAGYWIAVPGSTELRLVQAVTEGEDDYLQVGALSGKAWFAQQFTPTANFIMAGVKIKVARNGLPGTGKIHIRETDSAGKPTGADLASATFNANALPALPANAPAESHIYTWQYVTFGNLLSLGKNKRYALIVSATGGSSSYVAWWRFDNTPLSSRVISSVDSGVTWGNPSTITAMFQVFGYITPAAKARLQYDDTTKRILVVSDVTMAQAFSPNAVIKEYFDEDCTRPTGVSANVILRSPNIDTSTIPHVGPIDFCQTMHFYNSSQTPLEAVQSICLDSLSTLYSFYLEENTNTSLWPPKFKLFVRESLPAGSVPTTGLTVKFEGDMGDQERPMLKTFEFPEPAKEIYTEAKVSTLNVQNTEISSVKKAGAIAYSYKIFRKRYYQALQHTTQSGLNTNADNLMNMVNHTIQRGEVTIPYYPMFKRGATYSVVRAGEKIRVVNDDIDFLDTGTPNEGKDMVVTKIEYEEPTVTSQLSLKEIHYGIGTAEFEYPKETDDTYFPPSIDTRLNSGTNGSGGGGGDTGYGYGFQVTADLVFRPSALSPTDTVDWKGAPAYPEAGIRFLDGTTQVINSGSVILTDPSIWYIFFDLDNEPETLKAISETDGGYAAVMTNRTGLVCTAVKTFLDPPWPPILTDEYGIYKTTYYPSVNIFPLFGANYPLIGPNHPWIDMEGLTTYNFTLDGIHAPRYLYAIDSSQVDPEDGHLRLTGDTKKYDWWYEEGGVEIDSRFGAGIYEDMAFATFSSKAKYQAFHFQMLVGFTAAARWNTATYVDGDGQICIRSNLNFYEGISANDNFLRGHIWANNDRLKIVPDGTAFVQIDGTQFYSQHHYPLVSCQYDLGSVDLKWRNLYCQNLNIQGDILPAASCIYSLGSSTLEWAALYLNQLLSMGGAVVEGDLVPNGGCDFNLGYKDTYGCSITTYYDFNTETCVTLDINGDGRIDVLDFIQAKLKKLNGTWDSYQWQEYYYSWLAYTFGASTISHDEKSLRWKELFVQEIDAAGNIIPAVTDTWDIGSSLLWWENGYIRHLHADDIDIPNLCANTVDTTSISPGSGTMQVLLANPADCSQVYTTPELWYDFDTRTFHAPYCSCCTPIPVCPYCTFLDITTLPNACTTCDLNGDGAVNILDFVLGKNNELSGAWTAEQFTLFNAAWSTCVFEPPCTPCYFLDLATNTCLTCDLNGDHVVDALDLAIAQVRWQTAYPEQYALYNAAYLNCVKVPLDLNTMRVAVRGITFSTPTSGTLWVNPDSWYIESIKSCVGEQVHPFNLEDDCLDVWDPDAWMAAWCYNYPHCSGKTGIFTEWNICAGTESPHNVISWISYKSGTINPNEVAAGGTPTTVLLTRNDYGMCVEGQKTGMIYMMVTLRRVPGATPQSWDVKVRLDSGVEVIENPSIYGLPFIEITHFFPFDIYEDYPPLTGIADHEGGLENVEYAVKLDAVDDTYYETEEYPGCSEPGRVFPPSKRMGSIFVERLLPKCYYLDLADNTAKTCNLKGYGVVDATDLAMAQANWQISNPAQYTSYHKAYLDCLLL